MSKNLGQKLKDLRLKKKMSLSDLSQASKVSRSQIYSLEQNSESLNPRVSVLIALADVLNITVDYLIYENPFFVMDEIRGELILRKFNRLNEDNKKKVEHIIALYLGEKI